MWRPLAFGSCFVLSVSACGSGQDQDDTSARDADLAVVDAAVVDAAPAIDATSIDAPVAPLTIESTAITNGGAIPIRHSCRGANVSPPLTWAGGPTAAGYAVVLTDRSNQLVHSVIWDIPGSVTSIPENVAKVAEPDDPAGSKQPLAYDNQTRGYLGPCPGSPHMYEFALYAVATYPLPGVTLASSRIQVRTALLANDLAMATLTATFTP